MELDTVILLLATMIVHASVAYCTVVFIFKRKGNELKEATSPKRLIELAERVFNEEFEYKGKKTNLLDVLTDKIQEKLVNYAKGPEAVTAMNGFIELISKTVLVKVQNWAGGKIGGTMKGINASVDGAQVDIMGAIKQMIMNKILGSPVISNLLGGAQAPPPGGAPPG